MLYTHMCVRYLLAAGIAAKLSKKYFSFKKGFKFSPQSLNVIPYKKIIHQKKIMKK